MKATIIHDEQGQILGISKIGNLKAAGSKFHKVGMIPRPGQHILEIELSKDLDEKPILDLHNGYRVDIATSRLVEKDKTP